MARRDKLRNQDVEKKLRFNTLKKIALLFFVFIFAILCSTSSAKNYSALKKYLTAKMYGEAYMEILRTEVASDKEDKKLLKLKKDLLKRTKRQLLKRAKLNPDDPNVFSDKIFDFRRLTLAPVLVLTGYIIEIFAIMKKPKD